MKEFLLERSPTRGSVKSHPPEFDFSSSRMNPERVPQGGIRAKAGVHPASSGVELGIRVNSGRHPIYFMRHSVLDWEIRDRPEEITVAKSPGPFMSFFCLATSR
jgi:hypothetical protein